MLPSGAVVEHSQVNLGEIVDGSSRSDKCWIYGLARVFMKGVGGGMG